MSGIDPWIEAGIPPKVLLQAMTMNAARLLGVAKERGAIRAGMAADIIATTSNPLEDANALKKVVFVMKNVTVKQSQPRRVHTRERYCTPNASSTLPACAAVLIAYPDET